MELKDKDGQISMTSKKVRADLTWSDTESSDDPDHTGNTHILHNGHM